MFGLIKNNIKTKIGIVLPASYPASRVTLSDGQTVQNALYLSGLRFKNLGNSFTAAQATAIANGDFSDFWNGDYWYSSALGTNLRIVDNTDHFFGRGNPFFEAHGLVIMPDDCLLVEDGSTKYINDTSDLSSVGYGGCKYRTTYRSQCRTMVASFFGDSHIATYTAGLCSQLTSGNPSDWNWYSCDVELPTMQNMCGIALSMTSYVPDIFNYMHEWGQFRLFQLCPKFARPSSGQMALRDIWGSYIARLTQGGMISALSPSNTAFSVRPFFILI